MILFANSIISYDARENVITISEESAMNITRGINTLIKCRKCNEIIGIFENNTKTYKIMKVSVVSITIKAEKIE